MKTKIYFGVFLMTCLSGCKKDNVGPTTGELYNKPLSVIKASIEGNWQLHYAIGGIGNVLQNFDSTNWEFNFQNQDRIKQYYEGKIVTDSTITWNKGQDNYSGQSYIMGFYDKLGYPYSYIVDGIYEDTLVMHDNYDDAMFYHLTKQ